MDIIKTAMDALIKSGAIQKSLEKAIASPEIVELISTAKSLADDFRIIKNQQLEILARLDKIAPKSQSDLGDIAIKPLLRIIDNE